MDNINSNEILVENKRGQKIFWKSWSPVNKKPSKLVFICHGFGEYCECYERLSLKMVDEGFFVFSHDHVGHGKSEGDKVHIDDFRFYVHDLEQHVTAVKKQFPDIPCFVQGHSMGGAIAVLTCLDHPDLFQGLVVTGPALAINTKLATPFKIFMARLLSRILPQMKIGHIDPNHFTRNKEELDKIISDPMIWKDGAKAKFSTTFLDAMAEIEKRSAEFKLPYLIIHGTDDLICDIKGSEAFYKNSASTDKTLSPYEGAYHGVLIEPEGQGDAAVKEIITWIKDR